MYTSEPSSRVLRVRIGKPLLALPLRSVRQSIAYFLTEAVCRSATSCTLPQAESNANNDQFRRKQWVCFSLTLFPLSPKIPSETCVWNEKAFPALNLFRLNSLQRNKFGFTHCCIQDQSLSKEILVRILKYVYNNGHIKSFQVMNT